ncbi:monovalent cation/H+ antiporter complex subunit F [Amycolatopsis taiwanensis]|uniref:Multiple resistance and pH regulation protein F n=1 Tax=Amycolatopsis taiwanensis TaxID=342230 RepID=A0A9W6R6E1_9PSEU|nr:monovalent cation/H+ antiporter complex subunit F [Amycolatopsis taiwanensis]GLY70098.1 hypothetical protein Atai01_67170 [Amycolatopsis taiwanensis]
MNFWLWAAGALMLGGLVPAVIASSRGPAPHRLVGLQLSSSLSVLLLVLLSMGVGQSSYLVLPLVVVVLSFAGTLVYTRLLAPGPRNRHG